jgi:hypothetical protein
MSNLLNRIKNITNRYLEDEKDLQMTFKLADLTSLQIDMVTTCKTLLEFEIQFENFAILNRRCLFMFSDTGIYEWICSSSLTSMPTFFAKV